MSPFRKAGEKFNETKRAFVDGNGEPSAPESRYVCRAREASVGDDYEYCPHCGEDSVEAVA